MSEIDSIYQASIDALTPCEKVSRMVELFNWSREFLGRQVREENPDASLERVKLLVAMRMYGQEPGMKKLLEGALENVPN